jgi:hypothetical protein
MGRNIRDRREPNKRVIHITNRCWEGLPFVPNRFIVRLLNGTLARAQTYYSVKIVCYIFMGNHYHIIIAGDANRVSSFANYLDGEIAKRMMRLFPGRWGVKFWSGRFKEQLLPTPEAVTEKIAYIFCNPLRARLVSDLHTYPGASSVAALKSPDHRTATLCSYTLPRHYSALGSSYISRRRDMQLCKALQKKSAGLYPLTTNVFGWINCFRDAVDKKKTIAKIEAKISEESQKAKQQGVIGAKRLVSQPLDKPFQPKKKKTDRTPFVDCPDTQVRLYHIADYRYLQRQVREAWNRVKSGIAASWPRGSFCPGRLWVALRAT